ncbi:hypothetical protein Phum_PHUM617860 [Pediculus humanus corporis]|uniref:Uncharacterized protein n=1 Tax=Pediculus humanus subsp. corporis TaxID=121224 RepID=E0W4F2_PEDHC|nr:uncharacterized protein Phum_PHUM617860 [Pediculus humanus corporis]EEB20508.1 hypothetical protein Phum_PHUM617860 [Pediculus humanus corporis]
MRKTIGKTSSSSSSEVENPAYLSKLELSQSIPNIKDVENDLKKNSLSSDTKTPLEEEILTNPNDDNNNGKNKNKMMTEGDDAGEDEDYPNLLVQVEYYDITYEDLPENDEFVDENALMTSTPTSPPPPFSFNKNLTKDPMIILKNDDNGKKIILKGSDDVIVETETQKPAESTTPKAFSYSPTIPQASDRVIKPEVTTGKYDNDNNNNSSDEYKNPAIAK